MSAHNDLQPSAASPFAESLLSELRRLRNGSVLCWLATADSSGMPNVSPKEIFCLHGEREILIANIASPQSVSNIRSNPNVCVSFVDVFVQKGFKLKGAAVVVGPGHPRFGEVVAPLKEMAGEAFAIQSVICIPILSAEPIVAPSYRFREATTEQSQAVAALKAYRWPR